MTVNQFEALNETAKADAVWEGKFVSTRIVDDIYIQLYDLNGLYVDVYYDALANKITEIVPNLTYKPQ